VARRTARVIARKCRRRAAPASGVEHWRNSHGILLDGLDRDTLARIEQLTDEQ
jgi:hypothetical protein